MAFTLSFAFAGVAAAAACAPSTVSIFSFGSSWTETFWNVNGTSPSPANPYGNGQWCNTGQQEYGCNYIDYLVNGTNKSGQFINKTTSLSYNYAVGGTTINQNVVSSIFQPSFHGQVLEFLGQRGAQHNYSNQAKYGWTGQSAIFVIFSGDNDMQIWANQTDKYPTSGASTVLDNLASNYTAEMETLYGAGARYFLNIGVPAQEQSPLLVSGVTQTERDRYFPFKSSWDDRVNSIVNSFNSEHSDATALYYNASAFMDPRLANPTQYGYNANAQCEEGNSPANCTGTGCCIWSNNFHATPRLHYNMALDMASAMAAKGFPSYGC